MVGSSVSSFLEDDKQLKVIKSSRDDTNLFLLEETKGYIEIIIKVKCYEKTGVEMEALTATSIALLTIYDMCKAIDKKMIISDILLIEKKGGKKNTKIN